MSSSLRDQCVVIIGGSSGIGFCVAECASAAGAEIFIGSSGAENVERALKQLGVGAEGAVINVRDEASVAGFFDEVGAFDHLVYTAGDWDPKRGGGAIAELDLEGAHATFTTRFWGALAAIKHAHGRIAAHGSITLTGGAIAHRPRKGAALSAAMAGAIEHLTRALAVDLAPLRVNAVCPGYILTEVWNPISEDRREEHLRKMTERQPLARAGTPEEAAESYLYLMRGSFPPGQVLVVDGGMTLI